MADVLLFHHALGVTPGIQAIADELRAAGHDVAVPDLFEGATFGSLSATDAPTSYGSVTCCCSPRTSSHVDLTCILRTI